MLRSNFTYKYHPHPNNKKSATYTHLYLYVTNPVVPMVFVMSNPRLNVIPNSRFSNVIYKKYLVLPSFNL